MQTDLVPGLPPSGGCENIVTAKDVFSRYLFAYPTSNQDAKTVAQVLINIMTKHACLPTTLFSDKGTASTSSVIKEVAGVIKEVIKHDDLYARAWECEYDEPIFDSDFNNLVTPSSLGIPIRSDETANEMRSTPGTRPESSPEIISQPDRSFDGMDTD